MSSVVDVSEVPLRHAHDDGGFNSLNFGFYCDSVVRRIVQIHHVVDDIIVI